MMRLKAAAVGFLLAIAVLMSGCQSAMIAARHEPPIVPTTSVVPTKRYLQKLTLHWQDEQHHLLGVVEQGDRRVSLAVLTPEGVVLFSVVQTDEDVVIERNPMVPEALSPRRILAEVALLNWPLEDLVYPSPWQVAQTRDCRTLQNAGAIVVQAQYFPQIEGWQRAEMTQPEFGYRLEIVPLQEQAAPDEH
ncbi:MAG: DUF3261 domain-containing protein [Proteobacteria bacterium]|nr:DUF3261 domain-containing protein [Pseudomonadota bacterium]